MKRKLKPGTMLNPVPVVMVSCADGDEKNIVTVAWTGIVNSDPPMTYISLRESRYSHPMVKNSGEFVINLVTEELAEKADFCGVRSGRDVDKFEKCGFTPIQGEEVKAPLIGESPVNLECRVKEIHQYGSHDMFVAEILVVHADEEAFDEDDRLRLDKVGLVCYNHGEYFGLKKIPLGRFGHSVMKPKTKKRIRREAAKKRERKGRR